MKLEDQVTSLELSKQLKKASIQQESAFYWEQDYETLQWGLSSHDELFSSEYSNRWRANNPDKWFSAFTVAELGKLLLKEIIDNGKHLWLETGYDPELAHWWIGYLEIPVRGTRVYPLWEQDEVEANARAKMLIHISNTPGEKRL